jgi:hypothetical protein
VENLKGRLIEAISHMDEDSLRSVWYFIIDSVDASWDDIPTAQPDEWDLEISEEMKSNPECNDYVPADEAKRLLGLEDVATADDLAAHDAAVGEHRAGETVPHDAIDWG